METHSTCRADVDISARLRSFFLEECAPPQSIVAVGEGGAAMSCGRCPWIQEVDCMRLLSRFPEVAPQLFDNTLEFLQTLSMECAALCLHAKQVIRPDEVSIRLTHLPTCGRPLPSLPPRGGQLVQVCGSVVRMCAKRVVPYAHRLMCPKCHGVVEAYTHAYDRAAVPKKRCDRHDCKKEELQPVGQVWMDYAECRLQQRSNQSGRLPRSVLVTLDDELSTMCTVGQFVEIIGILHPRWSQMYPLSRPAVEPTIWATNVLSMEAYRGAALATGSTAPRRTVGRQVEKPKFIPEQFFYSFGKSKRRRSVALVSSTAPQLSGLFAPRMAILLSALGGACTVGKSSMHIRSTIHCLFVGDPSTGKSQLLRFAASLAPRSTSTTGMGSTSAGLTVAAMKEKGEWVLEPGALVLSDGGTCIIDELRTVSPADRASLHEAMEQQTISVAKAGLVTKLRTACAVLSACNPPTCRNVRTAIGVGGPLLSRFDFIFLIWDTPRSTTDEGIAEHILSCSVATNAPEPTLSTQELACYLWWVRGQYSKEGGPRLSDRAADLLGRYYELQRLRGASPALDDAAPVTIRLLESLVRITQAHAKLHLQPVCTVDDAAMAIFLIERTAHSLKVPLRALQQDLYSSSQELDDVFLDDSDSAQTRQDEVLCALVEVIMHSQASQGANSAWLAAAYPMVAEGDTCGEDLLTQQRHRGGTQAGSLALSPVRQSAQELAQEVASPFAVACARTAYGADPPRHSLTPTQLLVSQSTAVAESPVLFTSPIETVARDSREYLPRSQETPTPPVPSASAPIRATPQGRRTMERTGPKSQRSPSPTHGAKRKRSAEDIMNSLRFRF